MLKMSAQRGTRRRGRRRRQAPSKGKELAMHIAHAKDQRATLRTASAELRRLLDAVASG